MTLETRSVALDGVRKLGAQVAFLPFEWLPAALRRVGHAAGASANDIINWCELSLLVRHKPSIANFVTGDMAQHLQAGLGVDADIVPTMVMSFFPEDLVALRANGTVAQSKNWTRGSGTRYCPDCLRENPGVFYTYWRLWWCFLCERHKTVLRDVCPSCHGELVEATPREMSIRDPALCWADVSDGGACMHPLDRSWSESAVDESSPLFLAQQCLSASWTQHATASADVPASTLRGVSIALLGAGDINRVANLAGVPVDGLEGLFDLGARIGTTPPKDAYAMGALLGAAYRIVTDNEDLIAPVIRDVTYERSSRTDQYASAPWSARNFLDTWPGVNASLRRRVLRALDEDLSPIQRLVHGSVTSRNVSEGYALLCRDAENNPERPGALLALMNSPDSPTSASWRGTAVPTLMWPSWSNPLGIDDHVSGYALQRAHAAALRVAGTGAYPDYDEIAGVGRRLRPEMLGTPSQTRSILRQICDLAIVLRASPGPIDYEARRKLDFTQLLLLEHWRTLTDSIGEPPGLERRLMNAQRYAFMRVTATSPAQLPQRLRFRKSAPDAADYSAFLLTMSVELKDGIDTYLSAWLARFKTAAQTRPSPVTWAPPRSRPGGADLGRELEDIDVDTLNALRLGGEASVRRMAAVLDRSARHVRWAISEYPLSTGRATQTIDWAVNLDELPHPVRIVKVVPSPRVR
jgi:hypothetical protein